MIYWQGKSKLDFLKDFATLFCLYITSIYKDDLEYIYIGDRNYYNEDLSEDISSNIIDSVQSEAISSKAVKVIRPANEYASSDEKEFVTVGSETDYIEITLDILNRAHIWTTSRYSEDVFNSTQIVMERIANYYYEILQVIGKKIKTKVIGTDLNVLDMVQIHKVDYGDWLVTAIEKVLNKRISTIELTRKTVAGMRLP
jgi:hypothetical protein